MPECKPRRLSLTIDASLSGKTVAEVLREQLHLSGTMVKRAKRIPDGILLDGIPVFVIVRVRSGQRLSVVIGDTAEAGDLIPTPGSLHIVFEDEDLLILDKPAGLPVHPHTGEQVHTLANHVAFYYGQTGQHGRFRPVNRLDRGTSGLLCVAKHAHIQSLLKAQLHTGAFARRYYAVCVGAPEPSAGFIDAPIGRATDSAIRHMVCPDGKPARTRYETRRVHGKFALVDLLLETGRTHQIRVHMAYIGCPLVGDFLYGTEAPLIARPALHARSLCLTHPLTGVVHTWHSPLPEDIRALLPSL
ncbi:MAG: RluA family pseudouridine synthase [Oscillospiraceae bacterium]|nr:RluA family pseudouridine synthase [Oscillospiraceae bacterium]